jgi:AcrR family transcriptional regulator
MDRKWDPILKAAKQLFVQKGIAATSMDQVAAAAGATKRTVYNNFGSKERLVDAVFAEIRKDLRASVPTLAADADAGMLAGFAQACLFAMSNDVAIGLQRVIAAESTQHRPIFDSLLHDAVDLFAEPVANWLIAQGLAEPVRARAKADAAISALTAEARLDRVLGSRVPYPFPPEGGLDARDSAAVARFVDTLKPVNNAL